MSKISQQQINIIVNGEALVVDKGITIMDLLQLLEAVTYRLVIVVNDTIVPKSAYLTTQLQQHDHCDIMSAISGG